MQATISGCEPAVRARAGQAGVLVCTLDQTEPAVRLVNILRQHYPDITIHARGHDQQHCDRLVTAGASVVVSETLETSLQIGQEVLDAMGIPEDESVALIRSFREEYYGQ